MSKIDSPFFHAWFIILYFINLFSGITKEKTHLCDKCDQKFEYPSYLKNHIDTVHHGFYNVKSKNHSDPEKNENDSYLGHNGQDAIECRSCLIQFKFPR
jgi:hypothetical protein